MTYPQLARGAHLPCVVSSNRPGLFCFICEGIIWSKQLYTFHKMMMAGHLVAYFALKTSTLINPDVNPDG